MAQVGFTSIRPYYTVTPAAVPLVGNLIVGEIALNLADKRVFVRDAGSNVVELGTNPSSLTTALGSSSLPSYSFAGDVNTGVYSPSADAIGLSAGGVERARITAGGYFKASSTGAYQASSGLFHEFVSNQNERVINVRSENTGAATVSIISSLPAGASGVHYAADITGTGTVYQVLANGNVRNANNSYGAISDIKLKENVTDAAPKLADLNKLRVVNFNLISDAWKTKQIGLIAQEVEEVFPGLVAETQDIQTDGEPAGASTKMVKYSVLVPMLLKAVQELTARLEAAETKLANLS